MEENRMDFTKDADNTAENSNSVKENAQTRNIELTPVLAADVAASAKWLKYIGIFSIVYAAIVLLTGILTLFAPMGDNEETASAVFSTVVKAGSLIISIVSAAVMSYLGYKAYYSAVNLQKGLSDKGKQEHFLKSAGHFKTLVQWYSIIMIIGICVSFLTILGLLATIILI